MTRDAKKGTFYGKMGSRSAWEMAKRVLVGGVNSPVRSFAAVGGTPIFVSHGRGSRIFDIEGKAYIDYVLSWGPLIHGHAYPEAVKALRDRAALGSSFGAPTLAETQLAELIISAFESIQKVRLVNSGTEACMSAIRLARAYTRRPCVVKFEGCYHGHSDSMLVRAGSGPATFGVPTSPGVPDEVARDTFVLPYNNTERFAQLCKKRWRKIACVIVEPVAGNMGVVLPKGGFLETLRKLTRRYGMLLIFDEVITGFRLCWGGVQTLVGIKPDLTVLGKIIGGGLPVGAYGGPREIMALLAPEGPVYQAGTLSGNPLAVACGLATLKGLSQDLYRKLERLSLRLIEGLKQIAKDLQGRIPVQINRIGSMFSVFFTSRPVTDFASASCSDRALYARFFKGMLNRGVYLPPSPFESCFLSTAHSMRDIETTLKIFKEVVHEDINPIGPRGKVGY
jgi:glutamate-1-semialdehyde 2,1-aminomutase